MKYGADWYNSIGRNQVIDWNNFSFDSGSSNEANNARNVDRSSNDITNFYKEYLKEVKANNAAVNALNVQEAQKNRDWQTEMSNTAHQREVADLQAAGLNPVLSANAGASVGSGSQASGSDASGAMSSLAAAAISALTSVANTQANNAKDIAINQKQLDLQESLGIANLDLQKMLGLAGLDLQKYGIDVGHQNAQIAASASNYAANISKLNTELSNNAAYERLIEQGKIDLNKIETKADADVLVNIFKGEGFHGEMSYINRALAASYLVSKGILESDAMNSVINGSSGSGSTTSRSDLHQKSDISKYR